MKVSNSDKVVCVSNNNNWNLTIGKVYTIVMVHQNVWRPIAGMTRGSRSNIEIDEDLGYSYGIIDDKGLYVVIDGKIFGNLKEVRKMKLNKLNEDR